MWWAKLNPHTDASGNFKLCACSHITSRNGWHEIGDACYECRCRSCWSRPMVWSQRWFLGLENFLINAFHIDDDQGQRVDYLSGLPHWPVRMRLKLSICSTKGYMMIMSILMISLWFLVRYKWVSFANDIFNPSNEKIVTRVRFCILIEPTSR